MENESIKYLMDELTVEEKEQFLLETVNNEKMKPDFLENQRLITLVDWVLAKDKEEVTQQKLLEFIRKQEKHNHT